MTRGHHFVGDEDRAGALRGVGETAEEPGVGGDTARAEHGFDDHRGQIECELIDQFLARLEVVVGGDHGRERHVPRRVAVRVVEDATVVPAVHDHDGSSVR